MGKTLVALLFGALGLLSTLNFNCKELDRLSKDDKRAIGYDLAIHAFKEAISSQINPDETEINVYNSGDSREGQNSSRGGYSEETPQPEFNPNKYDNLPNEEAADKLEELNAEKKSLESLINQSNTHEKRRKILEDGFEKLSQDKTPEEKEEMYKLFEERMIQNHQKYKSELSQVNRDIQIISKKYGGVGKDYVIFIDDSNKNNKFDKDEKEKLDNWIRHPNDLSEINSLKTGDNVICAFKFKSSNSAKGKILFLEVFDEQNNSILEKKYINSSEKYCEGYSTFSAPSKAGTYYVEIQNVAGDMLFNNSFIVNE